MNIKMKSVLVSLVLLLASLSWSQQGKPPAGAQWPDRVKVAAVQTGGYDKWLNIEEGCNPLASLLRYIERAAQEDVQLLVFPEYHLGRIAVPGPETRAISKAAAEHGMYVIVGAWEVFDDQSFSSTALLFGRQGDIEGKVLQEPCSSGQV
jgi:predicted amidohydrolase